MIHLMTQRPHANDTQKQGNGMPDTTTTIDTENALRSEKPEFWRGFASVSFRDAYGEECSIQESSAVPYLWLGIDRVKPVRNERGEDIYMGRMHLSQEQAQELIVLLQRFVDTGRIVTQQDIDNTSPEDLRKGC